MAASKSFNDVLRTNSIARQHPLCSEVPDIDEAEACFGAKGAKELGKPRIGAHVTPIFSVQPKDLDGC